MKFEIYTICMKLNSDYCTVVTADRRRRHSSSSNIMSGIIMVTSRRSVVVLFVLYRGDTNYSSLVANYFVVFLRYGCNILECRIPEVGGQ